MGHVPFLEFDVSIQQGASNGHVDADKVGHGKDVVATSAKNGKVSSEDVLQAAYDGCCEGGVDLHTNNAEKQPPFVAREKKERRGGLSDQRRR